MPEYLLAEIAELMGGAVLGDGAAPVRRPCAPEDAAEERDLAVAVSRTARRRLADSAARIALVGREADFDGDRMIGAVLLASPKRALADVTRLFAAGCAAAPGIHPTAVVEPGAVLGEDVSIGPFAHVGPGARIGCRTAILGSATVAGGASLGADCLLHPGVRIGARVRIGDRAILHGNACVGADGFAFLPSDADRVKRAKQGGETAGGGGRIEKIHSLGGVRIGADVELGANCAIDRGTLSDTCIGDGVKIDNLVHVGHNVVIEPDCMLCGQVGIAGSARIGRGCVLGGQVGVADHVEIGELSLIGGKSMVAGRVRPGSILSGWMSLERAEFLSVFKAVRRLAGRPGPPAGRPRSGRP